MTGAEKDKVMLNYASLNGALELLPETLTSMAIIPLQPCALPHAPRRVQQQCRQRRQ